MEIKLNFKPTPRFSANTPSVSSRVKAPQPVQTKHYSPQAPTKFRETTSPTTTEKRNLIKKVKQLNSSTKWQENGSDPCQMFKMQIGERVAAKGVAEVDFPLEKVIDFFNVKSIIRQINQSVIRYDYLHSDEQTNSHIIHMEVKCPWPIDNRDFVLLTTSHKEGPDCYYLAFQSVDFEQPKQDAVVRGCFYPGAYILERLGQKRTRVTYVNDTDPCGSIPNAVKNVMSSRQGQVASKVGPAMKKAGY